MSINYNELSSYLPYKVKMPIMKTVSNRRLRVDLSGTQIFSTIHSNLCYNELFGDVLESSPYQFLSGKK